MEWKDLEQKYGWLLDIEKAEEALKKYDIKVSEVWHESCEQTLDKFGMDNCPEWMIDLHHYTGEVLEYGPKVGYVGDFETFGEFSRRYFKALMKVCIIAHQHADALEMK